MLAVTEVEVGIATSDKTSARVQPWRRKLTNDNELMVQTEAKLTLPRVLVERPRSIAVDVTK